ncbi:MAG: hypothetical protein A2297_01730 [Elusimicrobia bacterium RIFOXYB2_FULL_48_7]|nr:MAG: hypothetical protein A2297_01730 [Elusimicrobia bacterium RIFOXYB2_FULL_48_7]
MININLLQTISSSFTIIILIFCSIIVMSFAIERLWYFWRIRLDADNFMTVLKRQIDDSKFGWVLNRCRTIQNPLGRVIETAVLNHEKSREKILEMLRAVRMEERLKMERNTVVLGTMSNVCPFIGLFGTVIGIIRAFQSLAVTGSGGPAVVAAGLSEALLATAAGLAVAIPSVILFNYFMKKIRNMEILMANQGYLTILQAKEN